LSIHYIEATLFSLHQDTPETKIKEKMQVPN